MEVVFPIAGRPPCCGYKHRTEEQEDAHGHQRAHAIEVTARNEVLRHPADLSQHRAKRGGARKEAPAPAPCDREQAGIQQRDVTEQRERVVLHRRQQDRAEEAAEHAECRDDQCVQPDGDQERGHRDHAHQRERYARSERRESIDRMSGKAHAVENQYAGGAQRLCEHSVFLLAVGPQTAPEQTDTGDEAHRHTTHRRDQVVLECVFDEENDTEENGESAKPCEHFHAEELLDGERRVGGSACGHGFLARCG